MFSAETFALLSGQLNGVNKSVEDVEDSVTTLSSTVDGLSETITGLRTDVNKKWEIADMTLVSTQKTAIETSFSSADDKDFFSGKYTTNSYALGWYGIKLTSNSTAVALMIYSSNANSVLGVLYRDTTGNWTAKSFTEGV